MTDYDLLGLMDTHKALKKEGIEVPDTFAEFLQNVRVIDNPVEGLGPAN